MTKPINERASDIFNQQAALVRQLTELDDRERLAEAMERLLASAKQIAAGVDDLDASEAINTLARQIVAAVDANTAAVDRNTAAIRSARTITDSKDGRKLTMEVGQ